MRICFFINPTDDWQQAVNHGYQLARLAHRNHELSGVFFYGSAVQIVTESKHMSPWQGLSDCSLYLCRTMMDEYRVATDLAIAPFQVIGMAPWIVTMEQADRIVEII